MISGHARAAGVVLQYRIGTNGSWTSITGSVFLHDSSDLNNGSGESFSNLVLPEDAENNIRAIHPIRH